MAIPIPRGCSWIDDGQALGLSIPSLDNPTGKESENSAYYTVMRHKWTFASFFSGSLQPTTTIRTPHSYFYVDLRPQYLAIGQKSAPRSMDIDHLVGVVIFVCHIRPCVLRLTPQDRQFITKHTLNEPVSIANYFRKLEALCLLFNSHGASLGSVPELLVHLAILHKKEPNTTLKAVEQYALRAFRCYVCRPCQTAADSCQFFFCFDAFRHLIDYPIDELASKEVQWDFYRRCIERLYASCTQGQMIDCAVSTANRYLALAGRSWLCYSSMIEACRMAKNIVKNFDPTSSFLHTSTEPFPGFNPSCARDAIDLVCSYGSVFKCSGFIRAEFRVGDDQFIGVDQYRTRLHVDATVSFHSQLRWYLERCEGMPEPVKQAMQKGCSSIREVSLKGKDYARCIDDFNDGWPLVIAHNIIQPKSPYNHTIYIVLIGDIIAVCNRSCDKDWSSAVRFGRLHSDEVTTDWLETKRSVESMETFNSCGSLPVVWLPGFESDYQLPMQKDLLCTRHNALIAIQVLFALSQLPSRGSEPLSSHLLKHCNSRHWRALQDQAFAFKVDFSRRIKEACFNYARETALHRSAHVSSMGLYEDVCRMLIEGTTRKTQDLLEELKLREDDRKMTPCMHACLTEDIGMHFEHIRQIPGPLIADFADDDSMVFSVLHLCTAATSCAQTTRSWSLFPLELIHKLKLAFFNIGDAVVRPASSRSGLTAAEKTFAAVSIAAYCDHLGSRTASERTEGLIALRSLSYATPHIGIDVNPLLDVIERQLRDMAQQRSLSEELHVVGAHLLLNYALIIQYGDSHRRRLDIKSLSSRQLHTIKELCCRSVQLSLKGSDFLKPIDRFNYSSVVLYRLRRFVADTDTTFKVRATTPVAEVAAGIIGISRSSEPLKYVACRLASFEVAVGKTLARTTLVETVKRFSPLLQINFTKGHFFDPYGIKSCTVSLSSNVPQLDCIESLIKLADI